MIGSAALGLLEIGLNGRHARPNLKLRDLDDKARLQKTVDLGFHKIMYPYLYSSTVSM